MNRTQRRLNLGDLMILIVAIGVATASVREMWQGITIGPQERYKSLTPERLLAATALAAVATPLTLACLVCRLRTPRPRWRRVVIQPGTAAMIACVVVSAAQGAEVAASLCAPAVSQLGSFEMARVSPIRFSETEYLVLVRSVAGNGVVGNIEPLGCFGVVVTGYTRPCGSAVLAVWMVLALSGRWRPESSWVDRLGRLLGATWVVIALLTLLPLMR